MGYNKVIDYGGKREVYEYEREPRIVDRRKRIARTNSSNSSNVDLGTNGANSVSQGKLGKRHDHSRRAKLDFRRLVEANLVGTDLPVLLTLTCKDNITDLAYGYKCLRSFNQALRYAYGKSFRYVAVPEFQKRGAVHFHTLLWGLLKEVVSQERTTRAVAMKWGMGFVFFKQTDGDVRIANYLSKYMAKAFTDPRLKNQRSYVSSRNILRPVVSKGTSSLGIYLDEFKDAEVLTDEKYFSRFLGDCHHRIFGRSKE